MPLPPSDFAQKNIHREVGVIPLQEKHLRDFCETGEIYPERTALSYAELTNQQNKNIPDEVANYAQTTKPRYRKFSEST